MTSTSCQGNRTPKCQAPQAQPGSESGVCMRVLTFIAATAAVMSSPAVAGEYSVSNQWPTGIHDHTTQMRREDEPLCNAVANAIGTLGDIREPIACRQSIPSAKGISEVKWQAIEVADPLSLVKKMYRIIMSEYRQEVDRLDDAKWETDTRQRLANGELKIEVAMVAGFLPSGSARLVRFTHLSCGPKSPIFPTAHGSDLFVAEGENFERLRHLRGLGSIESGFSFHGRAFLYGHSKRDFDDTFQNKLPQSQPVLYVYKMYDDTYWVSVCRLLFWSDR